MYSIQCTRCGKGIISSKPEGLCQACLSRKANGKRLAADRKEQRAWEKDQERHHARQHLADMYECPLSEVRESLIDAELGVTSLDWAVK